MCAQRPEESIVCLLALCSTYSEAGSLPESRAHICLAHTPQAPVIFLSLPSLELGLQAFVETPGLLMWVGIHTLVLMIIEQVHLTTDRSFKPIFLFFCFLNGLM